MLENKDYCDYETSVVLYELGYDCQVIHLIAEKITLYEAQKWLREEKKIIVEVNFNLMYKEQPRFGWRILYNLTQHRGAYYTFDSVKSKEDYDSYEEALLEGIKETIKRF